MALYHVFPGLYVGSASLIYKQRLVDEEGIVSILRLDDHEHGNAADWPTDKYNTLVKPFPDMQPIPKSLFWDCVGFVHVEHDDGRKVLIHCAAGQSRSVAVAAAYLALHHFTWLDDALAHIRQTHPSADPHPALLASIRQQDIK